MRLTISKKLYAGFGAVLLFMAVNGVLGWRATVELAATVETLHTNNLKAAVHLANAQDTLWRLRYAIAQFQVVKPEERQKLIDQEPKLYAALKEQIKAYGAGRRSAEERNAIKAWDEIWEKYPAARLKWYELASEGKVEEAAAWRAANTTPYGNASVKTLTRMIDLQRNAADAEAADAAAQAKRTIALLVTLIAAGLGVSGGAAWMIARSVTKPLAETAGTMRDIAEQRDLTKRVTVTRKDELAEVAEAFNLLIGTIEEAVTELRGGARRMASASLQVSEASRQLSDGVQQQAASLEETAASMEELTRTVKQNADNAARPTSSPSGSAVADKGGEVVREAVETMGAINASSKKIADIISVDRRHRLPDQHPGAQRRRRSRARRRAGPRLRRGRRRGAQPRPAQRRAPPRRSRTLIADSVTQGRRRRKLVDTGRRRRWRDRGVGEARHRHHGRDRRRRRGSRATGIEQVNDAIAQMDKQVQSNAGQTRELSETAQALAEQAERLSELVGRFKLEAAGAGPAPVLTGAVARAAVRPVVAAHPARAASPRLEPSPMLVAHAGNGARHADDLDEF